MKANELRIGNFINYEQTTHVILAVSTTEADEYAESRWIEEKGAEFYFHTLDLIKPIPVTEDWLLRFGFKLTITNKNSGYKQYGINKNGFDIMFSIDCNCNPECFVENIGIEIINVHELQNLYFILTGVELQLSST